MSNATESPVETAQPIEDKPKPPFYRRGGCWSWFRTIVMGLLIIQVIISQYELAKVRERNEELRETLIDLYDDEIARSEEALRELREESQPPNLVREFDGIYSTYSVMFSYDGHSLVSSHLDETRLWDAQTGEVIRAFSGPDYFPNAVAISPDGQYIATSSWSDPTLLWDVTTGEMIQQFGTRNGSRPVTSLVFSSDGQHLLTSETGGLAKLWDIEKSQPTHIYDAKINYVLSVAFSPSGQYFVMGGSNGSVSLWNVQTGDKIRSFQGHTSDVNSVAFSPDGRSILTGSRDRTAILFETSTGNIMQRFQWHRWNINSVAFSPDGRYILTGSDDNTAILWEIQTGHRKRTFDVSVDGYSYNNILSVAFSPDGQYVVTAGYGGLQLWESGIGDDPTPPSADETRS